MMQYQVFTPANKSFYLTQLQLVEVFQRLGQTGRLRTDPIVTSEMVNALEITQSIGLPHKQVYQDLLKESIDKRIFIYAIHPSNNQQITLELGLGIVNALNRGVLLDNIYNCIAAASITLTNDEHYMIERGKLLEIINSLNTNIDAEEFLKASISHANEFRVHQN